ncbi:MAG: hypothetical protein IPJ74_15040 [Saprospiraceae bacterium]|nr:hypothetical protein [Saprospiraceae bacterium]
MSKTRIVSSRTHLAWLIVSYHFGLIFILFIYYLFNGFLPEEFTTLMSILTPIATLYAGTVFRYLGKSLKVTTKTNPDPIDLQIVYVHRLILIHFSVILFLLSSDALFNWVNFLTMITLLGSFEALFGGYMAYILQAVFGGEMND